MINNEICNLKFRDNLTRKIWLFLIFKDYLNVFNTGTTYQEAKNVNNINSYKDVLQKNKNNLDARVKGNQATKPFKDTLNTDGK